MADLAAPNGGQALQAFKKPEPKKTVVTFSATCPYNALEEVGQALSSPQNIQKRYTDF